MNAKTNETSVDVERREVIRTVAATAIAGAAAPTTLFCGRRESRSSSGASARRDGEAARCATAGRAALRPDRAEHGIAHSSSTPRCSAEPR